jgi:hypothetical protein
MPIDASRWYDSNPDTQNLYQGDIIEGVPVVITPPKGIRWVILRPRLSGLPEHTPGGLPKNLRADVDSAFSSAWQSPDGELVLAHASIEKVMIITQSCDLDWKKNVQVVPVFPIASAPPLKVEDIRANRVGTWFYLPADGKFGESFADLSRVTTVSTSYFRPDYLVKRLSSVAMLDLQNTLSDYYARPFGFNIRDEVPQETLYACANCFFTGQESRQTIRPPVGCKFPSCKQCGNDALWIKLPD